MPEIDSGNLQINQPITGGAPDTELVIRVDAAAPLTTGSYTFQLQVVDDAGNLSEHTTARVVVVDDQRPTAIIDAPERVAVGQGFTMSGRRSRDIGGQITRYIWTLVQRP